MLIALQDNLWQSMPSPVGFLWSQRYYCRHTRLHALFCSMPASFLFKLFLKKQEKTKQAKKKRWDKEADEHQPTSHRIY